MGVFEWPLPRGRCGRQAAADSDGLTVVGAATGRSASTDRPAAPSITSRPAAAQALNFRRKDAAWVGCVGGCLADDHMLRQGR